MLRVYLFALCLCRHQVLGRLSTNTTREIEENPTTWSGDEIWGPLLEDLAISSNSREKRILKLIPINSGFVADDRLSSDVQDPKESKVIPGKIINKKPTPLTPTSSAPGRQVSETDLYLLNAIEKLVFRMDFIEKRLRKVEEMLYYVMAGNRVDKDPCPENFTRAGNNCYLFHGNAGRELDWKAASKQCRKYGGSLAEMETIEENQDVITYLQSMPHLRGRDFWTGGLNPGLLWIWSNSARPVANPGSHNKKNPSANILGDGRCLRLSYEPSSRTYSYKGTDCAVRYHYICEYQDNSSSNEIRRIGRSKRIFTDEL